MPNLHAAISTEEFTKELILVDKYLMFMHSNFFVKEIISDTEKAEIAKYNSYFENAIFDRANVVILTTVAGPFNLPANLTNEFEGPNAMVYNFNISSRINASDSIGIPFGFSLQTMFVTVQRRSDEYISLDPEDRPHNPSSALENYSFETGFHLKNFILYDIKMDYSEWEKDPGPDAPQESEILLLYYHQLSLIFFDASIDLLQSENHNVEYLQLIKKQEIIEDSFFVEIGYEKIKSQNYNFLIVKNYYENKWIDALPMQLYLGGKVDLNSPQVHAIITGLVIRTFKIESSYRLANENSSGAKWGIGIGLRFRIADGYSLEFTYYKNLINYIDSSYLLEDTQIANVTFGTTLKR